jgi:hypothetical protein
LIIGSGGAAARGGATPPTLAEAFSKGDVMRDPEKDEPCTEQCEDCSCEEILEDEETPQEVIEEPVEDEKDDFFEEDEEDYDDDGYF